MHNILNSKTFQFTHNVGKTFVVEQNQLLSVGKHSRLIENLGKPQNFSSSKFPSLTTASDVSISQTVAYLI